MSAAGHHDDSQPAGSAAGFVSRLRARATEMTLGDGDAGPRWSVRVQMPEVWDAIRVTAPATLRVLALKVAALQALDPEAPYHDDFVVKLHGIEVLDENATLAEAGARDGSIFLLTFRRRRPVR